MEWIDYGKKEDKKEKTGHKAIQHVLSQWKQQLMRQQTRRRPMQSTDACLQNHKNLFYTIATKKELFSPTDSFYLTENTC